MDHMRIACIEPSSVILSIVKWGARGKVKQVTTIDMYVGYVSSTCNK